MAAWPASAEELVAAQLALAREWPPPWTPGASPLVAAVFVCFPRGSSGAGAAGDGAWAAAAAVRRGQLVATSVVACAAGAGYAAGLLALREGPALEAAVRALAATPDVLLVNATGRDHPRGAGLALHLGAVVGLPTVGVTHRPLHAGGRLPTDLAGARSPLLLAGDAVGFWLRTRPGTRPLAVHAAWRTTPEQAADVVLACTGGRRTPEPLREARRLAREERARAGGATGS